MGRIAIRVDDEKKADWEQAVEETREYSSLTHLIELAVHKELSGSFDTATSTDGSESTAVEYSPEVENVELYDRQRDIVGVLKEVRETVNGLEAQMDTVDSASMIHVYQRLPDGSANAVTPHQLADSMEMMSPERAEDVLQRLERTSGRVQTVTVADDVHYYKDE
jgi:UDP-N-acetylmuramoylalanine-D-glutamate ligase